MHQKFCYGIAMHTTTRWLSLLIGLIIIGMGAIWLLSPHGTDLRAVSGLGTPDVPPPITRVSQSVTFADDSTAVLDVAEGFDIAVAAEDLGKARFMTMSPDGRIFMPDMIDYNLSHEGRVLILSDFNEETLRFDTIETYLSNLRGPNNVVFYTDEAGDTWLYLTLTEALVRYPYEAGDTSPSGPREIVYRFPNAASPNADGVVWHITRTLEVHDGTFYIGVGSGCNSCEQPLDEERAVIIAMDPDGKNSRVYVEGFKNAVGLGFVGDQMYATENGTDHLGDDAPNDGMYKVVEGEHYGWPYCYQSEGTKVFDTTRTWEREPVDCADSPLYFSAFDAHSAPLGFAHFARGAHKTLENSFLVALQGSWEPEIGTGYQVMRVAMDGSQEVFIDGFMDAEGERVGRPVDILPTGPGSFFLTDDFNGRMYYVYAS